MSLYLYINLAIMAVPLILSFEKRIRYYSKLKYVFVSILFIGTLFVIWDVFATYRGHWSFNPFYVLELKLLGLPIEEILFFITVPFSCLFAYEGLAYFLQDKKIGLSNKLVRAVGALFIIFSSLFFNQEYTFLAILSVGLTLLFAPRLLSGLFDSTLYWAYIGVTFMLFFIFNYILTSVPIIEYSPAAITGFRATTIPIEDFMFNFSMLTLYLAVYLWISRKLQDSE